MVRSAGRGFMPVAVLGFLFLLFLCSPEFSFARKEKKEKDPSEIVRRVKKTLDHLRTFSCSFETEQVWSGIDRTKRITGTLRVQVKKPFRLRLERPNHITVIDGKTIWTYLPKHNQVQVSDYTGGGEQIPSPHAVFERYSERRKAVLIGEEEVNGSVCDVLSLESPDPDDVRITVWIDRKLNFPVKAVEETSSGDRVSHVLGDVKLNVKIEDDVFTFVPPEGAVVVDMRE